jgi:hypothetical protein
MKQGEFNKTGGIAFMRNHFVITEPSGELNESGFCKHLLERSVAVCGRGRAAADGLVL